MNRRWWLGRVASGLYVLLAPALAAQPARTPAAALAGFDQWVAATMAEWHVPGIAVGVIKDGKVVLAKGYGFRDAEAKVPVTERTVMAIGSNTKSFTVVLMGMLADEKKLAWDTPVRSYLPDFAMHDEYATREMTPRDLVTHRSGLPRHDNVWYGRSFTRDEMFRRLRYLEPTASFRSRYQYQNLMFMTAGYLTERITGTSWDDQISRRIFTPLGMTRASTAVRGLQAADDFSFPYTWRNDSLVRLPFRNIDAVGPAGSINASVEDMLKYIQFRIDRGTAGGTRLLSEEQERQMQSPQMVSGGLSDQPELGIGTYGLGVGVSSYRGRRLVSHGGGIDGFISSMSWMPEERLGIMVLSNLSGNNPVPVLVMRTLYDRLLGAPATDWVARQRKSDAEGEDRRKKEAAARLAEQKQGTSPSHPLPDYAGTYEHPGYGTLTIRADGGQLTATLDPHTARLKHFHYDVFTIEDIGNVVPFGGRVRFLTDNRGVVSQVAVPLEPAGADIVFRRK